MIVFWVFVGVGGVLALLLIAFGTYEFFTEHRQDMASMKMRDQQLHLKHLEKINNGK